MSYLSNLRNNATNFQVAEFMNAEKRSYPYGMSLGQFSQKVRNAMKFKDMTLSEAVTYSQASSGSFNNPH